MSTYQIHVFVSHSWSYSRHYNTLSHWIFGQNWRFGQASLVLRDFSVPMHDPIHNAPNDQALQRAIYNKIARSHVIVIPMGMYANYSKWMRKEIDGANEYSKRILGVNPRAQQRRASVVANASHETVGWTRNSVISAIWRLYRG